MASLRDSIPEKKFGVKLLNQLKLLLTTTQQTGVGSCLTKDPRADQPSLI